MAEKRMFSSKIIESDAFLDIPATAQMLYFHICMNADDDGFVNNQRKIIRMCGASDDDLKVLIDNRFLLSFDSGVVLVKHWRIHNYIPPDRYKPSCYVERPCREVRVVVLDSAERGFITPAMVRIVGGGDIRRIYGRQLLTLRFPCGRLFLLFRFSQFRRDLVGNRRGRCTGGAETGVTAIDELFPVLFLRTRFDLRQIRLATRDENRQCNSRNTPCEKFHRMPPFQLDLS